MKTPIQVAKIILILVISGCFPILSGCIKDKFNTLDCPIYFRSSIDTPSSHTRASNGDWHEGDRIGVYMVGGGGTIAGHALASNVLHRHTGGGNFSAEIGDELFYPRAGEVDFVAYYPWRTTYADHRYPIDVADQSDHPTIDFLYSDNAAGHSGGDVPLLEFRHRLSKLVFNIVDMTGESLDGLEAVLSGLVTRGEFHLSEGRLVLDGLSEAGIEPALYEDGDDDLATTRLEAIVLPEADIAPVVDFALPDGSSAQLRIGDEEFLGGKVYIYDVEITDGGQVSLVGGSAVIVDWDDEDRPPGQYQIPKDRPDDPDPDDPDPDDPDPSEEKTRYFFETFGSDGDVLDTRPRINDYAGWDNAEDVEFYDRFGGADVRRSGSLDAHIYFPNDTDAYCDVKISGLPADRSDITLSYDIAAGEGGVRAGLILVYADDVNMTRFVTATIPSPNRYIRVSIDIPSGTSSLRFVSDPAVNTCGMRIDNISLEGRKVGTPTTD
jgi:hypothetical protein